MRQNPAIRTLPKWLIMSALTATFLINVITFHMWRQQETTNPMLIVSIVWLTTTLFLVFGEVRTRCSPFDIALPIPTRKVWLSHLGAVIVSGVAIIAATVVPVAGGIWLLWKLSGKWMVPVDGLGGLGVQMCAGLILAVVLLQNPLPSQHRLPRTGERVILSVLVMGAVLALAAALDRVSPWTALITLALAATVGMYRYRMVPDVFSLATADSADAEGNGQGAVAREWEAVGTEKGLDGPAFGRFLDRVIWRCFHVGIKLKQSPWITYPFVLLFGALLAGFDARWIEDSMRFNYVWMAAYVLMAFSIHPPKQIYLIDGLPVSRMRLLNVLIAPLLVVMLAGYGAGLIATNYLDRTSPRPLEVLHMTYSEDEDNYYLRVPYSVLRVAWDGRVPEAVAPWGETNDVWTHAVFFGSRAKVYSPYSTWPGGSVDFVAWQLSRAVEAVYGETISPEELKARYLEERSDGTAALITKKLTISHDYPHLVKDRKAGPAFPVVMGLTFTLWMLSLAAYFQAFRARVSNGKRLATAFIVLAVLMLGWLSVIFGPIVRVLSSGLFNGFLTAATRQAGESVSATAAVWIVSIVVSAAAYRLALWRFERAEAIQERKATPAY